MTDLNFLLVVVFSLMAGMAGHEIGFHHRHSARCDEELAPQEEPLLDKK